MVDSGCFDYETAKELMGSPLDSWNKVTIYFDRNKIVEVHGCNIFAGYPAHYVTFLEPSFKKAIIKAYKISEDMPSNPTNQDITRVCKKY